MSMLGRFLGRLLPSRPTDHAHGRITLDRQPPSIYAIGDIHGRHDLLVELEAQIAADFSQRGGEGLLVSLGDGVDRGPASAQVIDHLMGAAPPGLTRVNLLGNHEALMLDFIARPRAESAWLEFGGRQTLLSYGVPLEKLDRPDNRALAQLVQSYVPSEHIEYLSALPVLLDTPSALFVHAGLRPDIEIAAQHDEDMLWYRDGFGADFSSFGRPVVHGHTIRQTPLVSPYRIAIDTGAVLTGALTAVRISPSEPPRLFSTPRRASLADAELF